MSKYGRFTVLKNDIRVLENTVSMLAEELCETYDTISVKQIKRLSLQIDGIEGNASATLANVESAFESGWISMDEYEELETSLSIVLERASHIGLEV